jgi:PEGA domain
LSAAAQPPRPVDRPGPAAPSPAAGARASAGERVGIIDLGREQEGVRRTRRAELEKALAGVEGVRPVDDPGLRLALAGETSDPGMAAGRRALAEAQAAFGALECARARGEADRAVLALAGAQAAGADVAGELRRAHSIRLSCADQGGDRGAAQSAATALRRLKAGDPPPGISDAVWSRYPALDAATGVQNARLAITTEPDGAAIWIDHAPAGKAPLTVSVPEGEHLVAAARPGGGAVAQRASVSPGWTPTALELAVPAGGAARWAEVEKQVRAWRSGARPDPAGIGRLLARAGLTHAVVLDPRGKLAVWRRTSGDTSRHLGNAADAAEIGVLVVGGRRGPGIDPNRPLLRETAEEREATLGERGGEKSKKQEWWVYAAVIVAVAVGAGVVLANDLGDDVQRIEIR